jgi:hypothetical protein
VGDGQSWGPQGPEKRLGNNPADNSEGGQDEPDPAIERKSILVGHGYPSYRACRNAAKCILGANCGEIPAKVHDKGWRMEELVHASFPARHLVIAPCLMPLGVAYTRLGELAHIMGPLLPVPFDR